VRARVFPNGIGIEEDEATGAAAIQLGALIGRDIVIRQGAGSELHARPGGDGTVAVGGRVELVDERNYPT
jgi:predicted PhzF superfamily epimerase YddE/YHI9